MKCEAGIHSPHCQGEGKTRDHFTPRCLGALDNMKWVHGKENFQFLDEQCHEIKDHDTVGRLRLRERQKAGVFISLDEYLRIMFLELIHTTEWDEKELAVLLKTYCNRPVELAMILEEIEFLSPIDLGL